MIPLGLPQIEDRALETLQQEWRLYQARLADTRAQLNSALAKLRQMEQKFQRLDSWLKGMETKAQLRNHRRSDRATKEAQLQLIKVWLIYNLHWKQSNEHFQSNEYNRI